MLRLLRSRRRKNGHRQGENQSRNPLGGGPECVCQTKGWKACLFGLCLRGSDSRSLKGPRVRIRFPPAVSQVRTCLSREFAFLGREATVFRGVQAGTAAPETSAPSGFDQRMYRLRHRFPQGRLAPSLLPNTGPSWQLETYGVRPCVDRALCKNSRAG